MLSFSILCLLVPYQDSALDLLGDLQRSADLLLICSCLRCDKRPSSFYKLNLEHKNCGMTKCLEKPLLQDFKNCSALTYQLFLKKN